MLNNICPIMSRANLNPDGTTCFSTIQCQHDDCMAWEPPSRCDYYDVCNEIEDKHHYKKLRTQCQEQNGIGKCIISGYCKLIG